MTIVNKKEFMKNTSSLIIKQPVADVLNYLDIAGPSCSIKSGVIFNFVFYVLYSTGYYPLDEINLYLQGGDYITG